MSHNIFEKMGFWAHGIPQYNVVFTEMVPTDKAILAKPHTFYIHYDNAYKFIFSLHGGISEDNVKSCCNVAMQRITNTINARAAQYLKDTNTQYRSLLKDENGSYIEVNTR